MTGRPGRGCVDVEHGERGGQIVVADHQKPRIDDAHRLEHGAVDASP